MTSPCWSRPAALVPLLCASLTALAPGGAAVQLLPGAVKELAAGKLLVAARGLPDPNFFETVILLAEHSGEGAMGLVVNRRTDVSIARLFPNLAQGQGRPSALYAGGPVAADGVVALLRSTAPRSDGRRVLDDLYMVANREGLQGLISQGADQSRFRVYLGYAGWGPGQLERETTQGAWHVFRADTGVVFDPDPDSLWQRQVRRTEDRMVLAPPVALRPVPLP
ncbi:MAG: YqgE/AlgH family protein [Vicinamibacteria bacterium]|nr:YqgE/AlgH family protein [Vicinamibacteria bacterium]